MTRTPLSDLDDVWISLPRPGADSEPDSDQEPMSERVRRIQKDLEDLNNFYNISISRRRYDRFREWFSDELDSLFTVDFDGLDQQDKADFLLLRNFLRRNARGLELEWEALELVKPVVPFAPIVVALSEARQDVQPMKGDHVARELDNVRTQVIKVKNQVKDGHVTVKKITGFKASKVIEELTARLEDIHTFYSRYDPTFDWWVTKPYQDAVAALNDYLAVVKEKLAGLHADEQDEIVGEPIGRDALLVELEAEMIAYSPEELIELANDQFAWCEEEMKKASNELGYGDDWKQALEYVKQQYVPPGEQPQLVLDLALEGADFVKKHDLVTVPRLSDETYRMFMMTPAMQKVAPFFLGGPSIMVSYPTADMDHGLKTMVMRGNNRHFARATAFHELIPGHRLQLYMADRYRSHRWLFATAFTVEGWGMYWEMNFWRRGDFFTSPEDKVGTLFWRMHRCARIILSLRFHLGAVNPAQCVGVLVDRVGHERATAEGEVRRWFNGEWAPLYQCGYMLGALQLVALREEAVVRSRRYTEKAFNDAVLRANMMPIELMRAVLMGLDLDKEYKPHWRFYKSLDEEEQKEKKKEK